MDEYAVNRDPQRANTSAAECEVVDLASALVSVDSVNPGLVPGAAGEDRIVELLQSRLSSSGFTTTVVGSAGPGGRPSLVAAAPHLEGAPSVVLNGHLDTVGVAGMSAPFAPRIEGDRLYGRGAADMKGGVAALVVAAERLLASGTPLRPILALVADEEDASMGSEAVIAALPGLGITPDACLIAEPTDLAVTRSLRGFAVVRVRFPGRAAHSSQGDLGVNAVTHLGRFLHAVDERAAQVRARGGDLMVTLVSGGSSAFVIPDHAECLVEMRLTPDQPSSASLDEVGALLDPRWEADVTLLAAREGWRLDGAGPAAQIGAALGARLGTEASFDAPYWMEAPLWQQLCPTLICGPGGGGLHAADEWLDLQQLRAFTSSLVRVLQTWSDEYRATDHTSIHRSTS